MRSAISESGDKTSLAEKAEGMETSKRAQRRKLDTAKANLKPLQYSEGRVSIARWNLKGMRRSTGP
jgi:hypothetical protein